MLRSPLSLLFSRLKNCSSLSCSLYELYPRPFTITTLQGYNNKRFRQTLSQQMTTPLPPFPEFYCWAWHHVEWDIPLVGFGQLSWLCPCSRSCPHPAYSLGVGTWWKRENALMLCMCFSDIRERLVSLTNEYYQHWFNYIPTVQYLKGFREVHVQ